MHYNSLFSDTMFSTRMSGVVSQSSFRKAVPVLSAISPLLSGARVVPTAASPPKQCTESMVKLLRMKFGVPTCSPPGRECKFGLVTADSKTGGKEEKGQSGKALGTRGEIMCFY